MRTIGCRPRVAYAIAGLLLLPAVSTCAATRRWVNSLPRGVPAIGPMASTGWSSIHREPNERRGSGTLEDFEVHVDRAIEACTYRARFEGSIHARPLPAGTLYDADVRVHSSVSCPTAITSEREHVVRATGLPVIQLQQALSDAGTIGTNAPGEPCRFTPGIVLTPARLAIGGVRRVCPVGGGPGPLGLPAVLPLAQSFERELPGRCQYRATIEGSLRALAPGPALTPPQYVPDLQVSGELRCPRERPFGTGVQRVQGPALFEDQIAAAIAAGTTVTAVRAAGVCTYAPEFHFAAGTLRGERVASLCRAPGVH
jgi:hypothetical protein